MKKFLYCDSCFLITFYQDGKLDSLSQFKEQFFISNTQIEGELIKPSDLALIVRKTITVISEDREEIKTKTKEFASQYDALSFYDCLCMAYSILDGYCLITDDKTLRKKCSIHNIETKSSKEIEDEFLNGGDGNENMKSWIVAGGSMINDKQNAKKIVTTANGYDWRYAEALSINI